MTEEPKRKERSFDPKDIVKDSEPGKRKPMSSKFGASFVTMTKLRRLGTALSKEDWEKKKAKAKYARNARKITRRANRGR